MEQSFNILFCVNENSSILDAISSLKKTDYSIFIVNTEHDLNLFLNEKRVHLVIIELDFELKDAIAITSEIRSNTELIQPNIIIFSDKQDDYIQITVFNSGADDFINTPIRPNLLEARIHAFRKRSQDELPYFTNRKKGKKDFFVDRDRYLVITEHGNISLPRKEFEMVDLMFQNPTKIFTRNDFAKIIWNSSDVANSRTIDIHIRNIRKILGNESVRTSKGIGYSLNL